MFMDIFLGIWGILTLIIFVIFVFEIINAIFSNLLIRKETINEVKKDIIDCLDIADALGYEIIFRTPECKAYKNCHLHVANTKEGKEVIMIDLIC
jgi:hypothetical protein